MSYLINFDDPQNFEPRYFETLGAVIGIYFVFLTKTKIAYPFKPSRLIYVGMSERRTNSIGTRLTDHYIGRSGNKGLQNYRKIEQLQFTYLNFQILEGIWPSKIEDLESYLLLDFVERFGVYPICNNKSTYPESLFNSQKPLEIDWNYFD